MADTIGSLFKIVLGLIFILIPLYFAVFRWKNTLGIATLEFIEAGITVFVILIGLALVIVGFSDV
nr:hypothetical protein [Candidatus Woesearchaeota archaeon]